MHLREAIGELLGFAGLRSVFGVLGSANAAWVGHGVASGRIEWVGVRHEGTAVAAAAAFARATGGLGVASVTLGPGFANAVNALAAAVHDHAPVLVLVGRSPSSRRGADFQSLDQEAIAAAVGAGFHDVPTADAMGATLSTAMAAARWDGTPQVLSIDEALLDARVERPEPEDLGSASPPAVPGPDPADIAAVVDVLAAARCPLLLAGRGAELSGCRDELLDLARLTGAALANTLAVHGFFAGHPRNLGVCGQSASPAAVEAFDAVDVVLAVGASLNSFTTAKGTLLAGAKIAQCEINDAADARATSPELALLGDARSSVVALIAEWRRRELGVRSPVVLAPTVAEVRASVQAADLGGDVSRGLDVRDVLVELDRRLPADRVVVTDGGRAGKLIPALVGSDGHRTWLPSRGYGSIGLGLPAAIGAAKAWPHRPIVLLCGDGGFMMSANELDTVRHHALDITVVVLNDQQYGSERKYLRRAGLTPDVARWRMPPLVPLARAHGGSGVTVRTVAELRDATLARPGLHLVDVHLDPEVDPANL